MGARFVRLSIAGFKSFADATTVEILPGLTGVVGPNGCGKSNVAEALRWAMGETNARHLRGGEMDDVIFAGTANRPARNLAEVAVTVEDDEGGLPAPFSGHRELQIVRRIDRGIGSSYRVNGREARARDVQTLFADVASGARSSAMVSQGRVAALVNARPEERRAVLEEAAGITGLHARRAEAETRLRATEVNLERAEERRAHLAQQMDRLSDQAKLAARYRNLVSGLQETEASLWAIQRERARIARDTAAAALLDARTRLEIAQIASTAAQEQAERQNGLLPSLRVAESEANAAVERAKMALEGVAADLTRAQAAMAAAEARKAQLFHDLTYAETTLTDAAALDARLATEAERLQHEAAEHPALLLDAQSAAEKAAAALLRADTAASDAAAAASAASAQKEAAHQILQAVEARHRRATESVNRLVAERKLAEDRLVDACALEEAATALAEADKTLIEATEALATTENGHAAATRETQAARESFGQQDVLRHRLDVEATALAEVLSIKDGEKWPPIIDSLSVPPGLEVPLGAALGEDLAAAGDPHAARYWRTLPSMDATPLPGRRLSAQVTGPLSLSRALNAIGLVDSDAEGASVQLELAPGQCVVSPSGAMWRWDGYTVQAGTATASTVRLQQRNRLIRVSEQRDHATEAANSGREALETALRTERELRARLDSCRQRLQAARIAVDRTRSAADRLRLQAEAAQSRFFALSEQLTELLPELEIAQTAVKAARDATPSQADTATLKAAADLARLDVTAARQRESAASHAVAGLHRTEQARQNRMVTIAREREDRRMRVVELEGRVKDLKARATEAGVELERMTSLPDQIRRDAMKVKDCLAEAETVRSRAVAERQTGEAQSSSLTALARTAEQASYAARETMLRAENAIAAAEQAFSTISAQIAERETALPPLPGAPEVSALAEERARARMKRLIRERDEIGPVNLRAEFEASTIEEEIGTIIRERDALATAIAKLRGSIGHLNREGRERLSAVFEEVDKNFQSLFSRMFGGGRAHLALVGSDDPLLAGVEIYAQPPGKKLSALSLLSGGEQALTALSLIFAVFRCNPAPLCILDEVDAPLDDANVGRFCSLLGDIVQETGTRFLVVTHHQVTMAAMDRLYGVTMQERGISRVLSVDLARALGMMEAVAAE
jgi:chromosome segregation protein